MHLAETTSTVYTYEDGILISTLKADHEMTLMDVLENAEVRRTFEIKIPSPILLDISQLPDMCLPAIIATVNQADTKNFSAVALVAKETIHDLIAREARRFKKTTIVYHVFHDKKKALAWLKTFLD